MSSESLNALDAAADMATLISSTKPAARLITNLLPTTLLKRGDQYQESSLKLLEASKKVMPPRLHDALHTEYDALCKERECICVQNVIEAFQERPAIVQFKKKAKGLHGKMKKSSQQARSVALWSGRPSRSRDGSTDSSSLPASNSASAGPVNDRHGSDVASMGDTENLDYHGSMTYLIDPFRETASVIVQDPEATEPDQVEDEETDGTSV